MDELYPALLPLLIFFPLVLALAYFSIKYGLGRRWQFQRTGAIKVLDRLSLSAKNHLYLVEAGDRYFIIAADDHGTRLVTELPGWKPVEPGLAAVGTGWKWLGRLGEKNEKN